MSKWQDIEIPKPKDQYKQNLPYKQSYNDYGFTDFNGMYSLVEENRDFRKSIQDEIVTEAVKTQNILGNHITGEADRTISEVNDNTDAHATEIKQNIQDHHNYVVNTVYGSVDHLDGNENWNVDTFLDYAEEAENNGDMMFNIYMSRSEFVNDIIYNLGNYWVDLDRNICDFNDPSFYKLIGYSLTLPETIDFGSEKAQYYWDNYDNLMKEGGLRLKNITFTDFRSDYFSAYADCNAVPVCIGWPSPDSN